ncbi:hypothetical protein HJFPF1_00052 [Paramyrothecium foliicola]|nr:hypothetical protein HJFPF1_00052 [Paramyrothecium foliicola]
MLTLSKTFSALVALSAVAIGGPVHGSEKAGIASLHARQAKARAYPELFTIYPTIPDRSAPAVDGIHMEAWGNTSMVEQVAIFRGIPAAAKTCDIVLHVANKLERVFVAKFASTTGESLVTNIQVLTGTPAADAVSFASIQGLYNETRIGAFDFAGWDISTIPNRTISTYPVPCAETLSFRLSLRQLADEKNVYLQQNEKNGYYIQYGT